MAPTTSFQRVAAVFIALSLPSVIAADEPTPVKVDPNAQRLAEAKATAQVLAAEARALLEVFRDPDTAYQRVKNLRDSIVVDSEISEPCREVLTASLETTMRRIFVVGAEIKRMEIEQRQLKELYRQRLMRLRAMLGM